SFWNGVARPLRSGGFFRRGHLPLSTRRPLSGASACEVAGRFVRETVHDRNRVHHEPNGPAPAMASTPDGSDWASRPLSIEAADDRREGEHWRPADERKG